MSNFAKTIILLGALTGCASTSDVSEKANNLTYPKEPSYLEVINKLTPSGVNHYSIENSFRCYASKMQMTDNVNPKYNHGYWCYTVSSRYSGKEFWIYHDGELKDIHQIDEVVRKSDDVWVYVTPSQPERFITWQNRVSVSPERASEYAQVVAMRKEAQKDKEEERIEAYRKEMELSKKREIQRFHKQVRSLNQAGTGSVTACTTSGAKISYSNEYGKKAHIYVSDFYNVNSVHMTLDINEVKEFIKVIKSSSQKAESHPNLEKLNLEEYKDGSASVKFTSREGVLYGYWYDDWVDRVLVRVDQNEFISCLKHVHQHL